MSINKNSSYNIPIVFIVTRGRSGSTLIQNILDSHPNIYAPNEADFILFLKKKYANEKNWTHKTKLSFIKDLYVCEKFKRLWEVDKSKITRLFLKSELNSFSEACKLVYLSYNSVYQKEEALAIIDKLPRHSRYIPDLIKLYPNAKFIHLIRDPRAVVNSIKKSFNKNNIPRIAQTWVNANKKIDESKNKQYFLTVKFEDFLLNPDKELKRIFNFIEIPYTFSLIDAYKVIEKTHENHPVFGREIHQNISKKIDPSVSSQWKTQLSEKEINQINYLTADYAIKYEYNISKPKLKNSEILEINKKSQKKTLKNLTGKYYELPIPLRKFVLMLVKAQRTIAKIIKH